MNYSEVAVKISFTCTGKLMQRDVNDLLESQMRNEWQWGGGEHRAPKPQSHSSHLNHFSPFRYHQYKKEV